MDSERMTRDGLGWVTGGSAHTFVLVAFETMLDYMLLHDLGALFYFVVQQDLFWLRLSSFDNHNLGHSTASASKMKLKRGAQTFSAYTASLHVFALT